MFLCNVATWARSSMRTATAHLFGCQSRRYAVHLTGSSRVPLRRLFVFLGGGPPTRAEQAGYGSYLSSEEHSCQLLAKAWVSRSSSCHHKSTLHLCMDYSEPLGTTAARYHPGPCAKSTDEAGGHCLADTSVASSAFRRVDHHLLVSGRPPGLSRQPQRVGSRGGCNPRCASDGPPRLL